MRQYPGVHITDPEWITIIKWRESNPTKSVQQLRAHFARPENGSLCFSRSAFNSHLEIWNELKKGCCDGEEPTTSFRRNVNRPLKDEEWAEVFAFVDQHPNHSREKVADHFHEEGRLQFSSSALNRRLVKREDIERRVSEAKEKVNSQSRPYSLRTGSSSGTTTVPRQVNVTAQARQVLSPATSSKRQKADRHQTANPYPSRTRGKGKAEPVTPSLSRPGSWASSRSTLSPASNSSSRLSIDLSLYDPTPTSLPVEPLPDSAGNLDLGEGHFWVYGYLVSSLSGLATLNRDVFKRKESEWANDEEETKLDLWSGTCNLIANLKVYTGYPDIHLALVFGDDQMAIEGRTSSIGAETEKGRDGGEEGSESGKGRLVGWAITLVCAERRGKYIGRPAVGHLRKLEPMFGRPRWFEALKDRKTFCFEV